MIQLLYADIDGVLNDHSAHPNGFTTMHPMQLACMNQLLKDLPGVQIVLSSAWRYQLLNGNMTLAGLEILLQTHGLDCYQRLHSVTEADEADPIVAQYTGQHNRTEYWEYLKLHGSTIRSNQIRKHMRDMMRGHSALAVAVIDDLKLDVPRFVQTEGKQGMNHTHSDQLRRYLEVAMNHAETMKL